MCIIAIGAREKSILIEFNIMSMRALKLRNDTGSSEVHQDT